jgi:predicted alpha/beta superfamily hydrolase
MDRSTIRGARWTLAALGMCLIWPAALGSQPGSARPFALERAEIRSLESKATGVGYKLYISLPHSYDGDTFASHRTLERKDRYPVIYLLDADYSFLIARNITDHLAERGDLPEVLLVGIAYDGPPRYRLHRTRDYTPTFVPDGAYGPEYQRHSGGGGKFLRFLADELAPWIEKSYRAATEDRTIVGHSLGGLFATFALLEKPGLFRRVIAVSPSLWYDERFIFRREKLFDEEHTRLPATVYYAVGRRQVNGDHSMVSDLEAFSSQVRRRAYKGLELRADILGDETHNSIFPRALSNGLRFVFGSR